MRSARRTAGYTIRSGFRLREPVFLDPRVELGSREAEQLGGARLVVPCLRERLDDERPLDRVDVHAAGGQRGVRLAGCRRLARRADGQVLAADVAAVGEDDCALDRVAQLAHVAGPRIVDEVAPGLALEPRGRTADGFANLAQERVGELEHVLRAFAQRRQLDLEDAETVIEVLAEPAAL